MRLRNSEIRFEVTNMCNARCIMCPREKMARPQGIMDMELYKRVLDEAVEAGAAQVSLEHYGESLMDPYIFDRAEYAKSKGMQVYTITNAALLDKEKADKMIELFDKVRLSMYAVTKEIYEKIHKGLSFEKVKDNIDYLFKARNMKQGKLKIEMYFLLLKENETQMKDFLNKYEKLADAVSVWKPHNWGNARAYREPLGKKVSCKRPLSGPVQVQWDGLVVPCVFDYDNRIVLGDLKRETLKEVLHSEEYEAIRRAHREGDFSEFPYCDSCDQLNKREDVLIYTTLKNSRVGMTNTAYVDMEELDKEKVQ